MCACVNKVCEGFFRSLGIESALESARGREQFSEVSSVSGVSAHESARELDTAIESHCKAQNSAFLM